MIAVKYLSSRVLAWAATAVGVALAFLSTYRSGKKAAEAEALRVAVAATTNMTAAAVKAPTEKADVAADLRAGKF